MYFLKRKKPFFSSYFLFYHLRTSMGFSLLEVMIGSGISILLLSFSSTLYLSFLQEARLADVTGILQQKKNFYLDLLSSDLVLKNSINKWIGGSYSTRASLACLFATPPSPCSNSTINPTWTIGGKDRIFQLYNKARPELGEAQQTVEPLIQANLATGVPFLSNLQTSGFDTQGKVCNTFNPLSGNDNCPFQTRTSWTLICPGGSLSCLNPKMIISVNFVYKPFTKDKALSKINMDRFQISLEKEPIGPNVMMANSEKGLVYSKVDNCANLPAGFCYAPPLSSFSNPTQINYTNVADGTQKTRTSKQYVTEKKWTYYINAGINTALHAQVSIRSLYNSWDNGNHYSALSNSDNALRTLVLSSDLVNHLYSTYEVNSIVLIDNVYCASGHAQFPGDGRYISSTTTCIQQLSPGNHQIDIIGQSIVTTIYPQAGINYVPWLQTGNISIGVYK